MLPEPVAGFTASLEKEVRKVEGKIKIISHNLITSIKQDGEINVTSANKYAQNFTIGGSDLDVRAIDVFISRKEDTEQDINIRILGDSAGMPDTGTVLGEASLFNLDNKRPRFQRITFLPSILLTASTTYWLEISVGGGTSINWYKDSTATGFKYALNDTIITNNQALIMKVLSKTEIDNEYELPRLLNYSLDISENFDNDVASITLSNIGDVYREGQPLRNLLIDDIECSFYIGNGTDFLQKATLLLDTTKERDNTIVVNCIGKGRKLLTKDVLFKNVYIGQDYSIVVDDLLKQGDVLSSGGLLADDGLMADDGLFADTGVNQFDLTGKTFPSTGTLEGSILNAIKKIEEVTNFIFYFDESGEPVFEERNDDYTPLYTLEYDKHIFDKTIDIQESNKNIINRIRYDNGLTSDGESIVLDKAGTVITETGNILSGEKSIEKTHIYPTIPLINAELKNMSFTTNTTELVKTVNQISLEIQNIKYPNDDSVYNYEISGSEINNYATSLLVQQKSSYDSIVKYGINDLIKTNNLFVELSNLDDYISRLLYFNARARIYFFLDTRGVPVLQNRDTILVEHPDLNIDFVYKIQSQTLKYQNEARQFTIKYEINKYPFLNGEAPTGIVLRADNGLTADSGLEADTAETLYKFAYI